MKNEQTKMPAGTALDEGDPVAIVDGKAVAVAFKRQRIAQNRGPVLEFEGRMLAWTEFETRGHDPMLIRMEIWQTRGAALIAVSTGEPLDREGFKDVRARVVEPIASDMMAEQLDDQAMHFAVLEAFEWSDRARRMVKDQLGWNLKRVVA